MAEKILNSRIIQKHDIAENWEKAINFIPKQGEIIVYDIDSTHPQERFKIGDGTKSVNELAFIGEKASIPDWDANNGEEGYIANRTHYTIHGDILLDENVEINGEDGFRIQLKNIMVPEVGKLYKVVINNQSYICTAWEHPQLLGIIFIGNGEFFGIPEYVTNEPFLFAYTIYEDSGEMIQDQIFIAKEAGEYSIKIYDSDIVHKLDPKYIPNSDWSARVNEPGHILNRTHWKEEEISVVLEEISLPYDRNNERFYIKDESGSVPITFVPLEGTTYVTFNGELYETKSRYMDPYDKNIMCEIGNLSIESQEKEDTGEPFYIFIVYDQNAGFVPADCFLLANSDITDNITLKIEGVKSRNIQQLDPMFLLNSNIINGNALGSIRMLETSEEIGPYAFAEGSRTSAIGDSSHAEGFGSEATGTNSHAEGESTIASAMNSHAEGYRTKASSEEQHVQGKYNIEDVENVYAHIVGNGTFRTPSNAHTLDWNGNAWFQGTVKIGGVGQDDEAAKELATQEYVNNAIATTTSVQSVNGKTGEVELSPADIGAQPVGNYITEETDPTVPAWAKATIKPAYTASEVGADPVGTATSAVAAHNTATGAHNDMRLLIEGLTTRLNTLADSDDTTLDQMSEIVTYIKSNKSLIEDVTTNKVNVSDIIDNLTTNVTNKPLSAAQGVALKALIDSLDTDKLDASALTSAVNGALAQAKASGEFDGADGVGVSSVKQTTTSTADDGNNVITVTLSNGTTSTFTVQNGSKGSKGDKGDSPVRGTDYWTDADKAEIKSYVDEAILGGAW